MKTMPLSQNKLAIVDDDDFIRFGFMKWSAGHRGSGFYAFRNFNVSGKKTPMYLHRLIAGAGKGVVVDHINHDTLDCRKSNLRICTVAENMRNRRGPQYNSKSMIRGVYFDIERNTWNATIGVSGKTIALGRFKTKELAIVARVAASEKYFAQYKGEMVAAA